MRTSEIAELVGGELRGKGNVEITSCADLRTAGEGQLAFVDVQQFPERIEASCVIAPLNAEVPPGVTAVLVSHPKLSFSKAAGLLHPPKLRPPQIHKTAVVSSTAIIGAGVFIGAYTCIGDNSSIGDGTHMRAGSKVGDNVNVGSNCVLHPNVFVEDGCTLGDRVVLHSGTVIGADGFGFVRDTTGGYVKFPQIGSVVIESDVEIGANTCVDRGALGETRIGAGTKIDNLVQVGHNVSIGKRCVIAAQTGISGSVVIEDDCVIGGQVGFGDHVRVQSGAIIGSQAGILPGKIVRPGVWWGTPIQPLEDYKRHHAHLKGIGRLKEELKQLRAKLQNMSGEEV